MKYKKNWIQYGGILIKSKLLSNFTVKKDTLGISYNEHRKKDKDFHEK